ncbi:MAG: gamma carbonic anhydrase family protein [Proteobacteria bacterium]|nr:gamma carbonic anhydrase family protein [Pseudomonadota bacterium]
MKPEVAPEAWIDESAQLFGAVSVAAHASVWPRVVIRAECQEVSIGRLSNVQDFVMIHVGYGHPTVIGEFCSITHHATVHGATIEDQCLVGINATIMDGAVVGAGSVVAPGAVVTEGTQIPPGSIAAGIPAKVIRQRDSARENRLNAWLYHRNAAAYRRGEHRAWSGAEFDAWRQHLASLVETDADLALPQELLGP